jgi:hypothetical protein
VPALLAALLALPIAPGPAQAQVNLPALGDSVSEDFGIGAERRLGDQIMREIRRDPDYLDDPILDDYLESVWQPLLAASRKRGNIGPDENERFAWEPFLVRDKSVNAFALPGGYVGVHLGMIAVTSNRDELASVLAHEMSHVTQRHIARSMVNGQRQGLIGMAAMILGALAASPTSERLASPVMLRAMWRCVMCDISCASTEASSSRVVVIAISPRCTPTKPPGSANALTLGSRTRKGCQAKRWSMSDVMLPSEREAATSGCQTLSRYSSRSGSSM